MPLTRAALAVSLVLAAGCESQPKLDIPPPTAGSSAPMPPDDIVAVCDQAPDGTPCDEARLQKHCIFGACAINVCGDGVAAYGEQCDDGNDRGADGCSATCRFETEGRCGNGVKEGSEECDDGNRVDSDLCANACLRNACRNGRVDPGEECDDGNLIDSGEIEPGVRDTCSNNCTFTLCGNVRVDPGEECDDGNHTDTDACSNACTTNVCGNLRLDPGEVCDGNPSDTGAPCKGDCSGHGIDACRQCFIDHCGVDNSTPGYEGFDFVTPCFDGSQDEEFSDACQATFSCSMNAPDACWTNASEGPFECYCGVGADPGECQAQGPLPNAPCVSQWEAATHCPPGDSACVMGRFNITDLPAGLVRYGIDCLIAAGCADSCGGL